MMKEEIVKPYTNSDDGKKEQVRQMFNNISSQYDFLNHLLSMGIDKKWRKKAVNMLGDQNPEHILDMATGTGDFALECMKLNPKKITGVDISEKMLEEGRKKIMRMNLQDTIVLERGDSENLVYKNETFDAAVVAFGVRNFENLEKGIKELQRVLKPSAKLVVLEFSMPHSTPFKQIYGFYFSKILPKIGALISNDARAYKYLNESVEAFPEDEDFMNVMKKCGFTTVTQTRLMLGIASIYVGKK